MDLLSSYDDDGSSTPKGEQASRGIKGSNERATAESLQSEWDSFEKMIDSQGAEGTNMQADSLTPSNSNAGEDSNGSAVQSQTASESSTGKTGSLLSALSAQMSQEEDDESHLPPGVRRRNRVHDSSSEEEEEDKKPDDGADSSSDSDSDASPKRTKRHSSKEKESGPSKEMSKSEDGDKEVSKKRHKSRSRSGSRSRSKSRSPSHRKKRRSSERSRHSRSRSRDRHSRRERRRRSHRSRSRDRKRSRDRDRHRGRRDHRRSRSRDRRDRRRSRRSRSKDRSRRSRSRSRSHRRDRSRSRSRSVSPRSGGKIIKFGDKLIKPGASFGRPTSSKPMTFKEKMRQQLIKAMEEGTDASQALTNNDGTVLCTQTAGTQQMPQPKKPPVPLMANIVTSTASLAAMTVTASEAALQSMLALQKETTEKTGVEIPKYYNPAAINPVKYAEQVQKRKLLWSKTKDKDVNSQWHATTLSSEHDDKSKEKFRKLMGIRGDTAGSTAGDNTEGNTQEEQTQKQRELFDQLDKEYQFARMATHTHRGIGLGFGTSSYQPPSTGAGT